MICATNMKMTKWEIFFHNVSQASEIMKKRRPILQTSKGTNRAPTSATMNQELSTKPPRVRIWTAVLRKG